MNARASQQLNSTLKIPRSLKPGDCLAIISPAAPSQPDDMDKGVQYLTQLGFKPRVMPHALDNRYYLAGSDTDRLTDLHNAFADPDINGILCARGGYGCLRLLPQLHWDLIAANPKVFIGFSDLTTLLLPIWERTGLITFHGPMLTSNLIENDAYTQQNLWNLVAGRPAFPYEIPNVSNYSCINPGTAQGPLVGGNLSLLTALCGTPFQPRTQGCILFIEDWREQFYSIDRQWQQLKLAGMFDHIAGLILGDFVDIEDKWPEAYTLVQLLTELAQDLNVPIGLGFSIGHGDHTATLPIGARVSFESTTGRLQILSSVVDPESQPAG